MKYKKERINKKGFTLVELLVAISILGLITVIAIPQLRNLQDSNRDTKYKTYGDSVLTSGKLYTDSYSQDMFGNNSSGCVDIPYSDLKKKNLVKDIKIDQTTCGVKSEAGDLTFVRVRKAANQYRYELSIVCQNKAGQVVYENQITTGTCNSGVDKTGPAISISPNGKSTWSNGNGPKVTVKVSDDYGLLANTEFKYAWTSNPNNIPDSAYKTYNFKNKQSINTTELTATVDQIGKKTGIFYLVVKPIYVRDLNGNRTVETIVSKAFNMDNTPPTITSFTNDKNDNWTNDGVTITVDATDNLSGVKTVHYTYNSDGTNLAEMPHKTKNGLSIHTDGTWTYERDSKVYVIAEDEAGNKSAITEVGTVKIDKTKPTVIDTKVVGINPRHLEGTIKDTTTGKPNSKVVGYAFTTISTTPNAATFIPVTATSEYKASSHDIPITPGVYYLWGIDAAGNISDGQKIEAESAEQYSITYDANGGENAPSVQLKIHGTDIKLTTDVPTRAGYQFIGWSTKKTTGVTKQYSGGETYTENKNLTLYAVWKATFVDYINYLYKNNAAGNKLADDGTANHNIRYYGTSVNNYVWFNDELWRIIGIMKDSNAPKVKIIREEALGNNLLVSWDSSASNENSGFGIDNWPTSDLAAMLNNYYIGKNDSCTYCNDTGQAICKNSCNSIIKPLSTAAINMLENTKFYLGALGYNDKHGDNNCVKTVNDSLTQKRCVWSAQAAYKKERAGRGSESKKCTSYDPKQCGAYNPFTNTWTGLVGVPYPSDYGFAFPPTSACITDITYNVQLADSCVSQNWLNEGSSKGMWTISPREADWFDDAIWSIGEGSVYDSVAAEIVRRATIRPTVHLKASIRVVSGNGTKSNPYKVEA